MTEFDVIVVGAGAAGVCCAGELVLRGVRPLLIAEASEVGYQFRPKELENGRAIAQYPSRNLYGDGGWWYSLAQRLNVPINIHRNQAGFAGTVLGSGVVEDIPSIVAAVELADIIARRSTEPLGSSRAVLDRVLHRALTMPADELAGLHDVSLAEWLEKEGADDLTMRLCLGFATSSSWLEPDQAEQYLSVFGVFARLRSYFCGHHEMCTVAPDPRSGLFVPLARAIEQRGGTVWRSRRVRQVLTSGNSAIGAVLDDGTEARAPIVALAAGTSRLASLFPDGTPPEIEAVVSFEQSLGDYLEYISFAVVDRTFYRPPQQFVFTSTEAGERLQVDWSVSSLVPWATLPGWEIIATEVVRSSSAVAAGGGTEALHARMREVTDCLYPGFQDAIVEYATDQHPQFITPLLTGPKLPRQSPCLRGLWFVGEGSTPVDGVYTEGAASAGILGARSIAQQLASST